MRSATLLTLVAIAALALCASGCERKASNLLQVVYKCSFSSVGGEIPLYVTLNLGDMEGKILTSDTGLSVRPVASTTELHMTQGKSDGRPHEVRIRPDGSATLLDGQAQEMSGECSRT